MGEGRTDRPNDRPERLTVAQCADRLGISEDAVRSRIKRGTLRTEKVSGVVHVLLGADRPKTDEPTDQGNQPATDYRDELIAELRDRVRSLEEANRENRRIIMQQAQTLAAIEAPPQMPQEAQEAAEAPQSASEGADRGEEEGAAEPTEAQGVFPDTGADDRRPWWRKIFGG
jgi:predicted ArsR family transcriptional regulator